MPKHARTTKISLYTHAVLNLTDMVRFLQNWCFYALGFCMLIMQNCLGASDEVKAGIGIFDTLYIAGHSALGIHGDVYLADAHVLGQGSLVMKTPNSGKIISERSEVNNLEVITFGKVSLKGELAVRQSLTIQYGILDISAGTLQLTDSTNLKLQEGAGILQNSSVAGLPAGGSHPQTIEFTAKAILTPFMAIANSFCSKIHLCFDEAHQFPSLVYRDAATVPPEHQRMITV